MVTNTRAPSTLIRFQTKTELFCSVFNEICVQTYRFRIVFARLHYNAVSVLKTLLYTQCECSNELGACAFQIYRPAKLARNWSQMVASVRHFGYSRSSGLAPGRVYLMMSSFSDSIVFSVHTRKQRFQKASFSNRSTLESVFEWFFIGHRFRRCSEDNSRIRSKTALFSFENGLMWTGPSLRI